MADEIQTWPTSITWQGNSIYISSHWTERRFDSNKSTIDLIIWKGPWLAIMTSVDADLRSGRRWETGRRSESIRYILNNISFILYSFLTYLYCRKNIMVLPKGSQKHISSRRRVFDCQAIMLGGRVLQHAALLIANLFLYTCETSYRCFSRKNEKKLSRSFNVTFHYTDDVLS